jgi:hypothetical protein
MGETTFKLNYVILCLMFLVFMVLFPIHVIFTTKNMRNPEMRSLTNTVIGMALGCTIVVRLIVFVIVLKDKDYINADEFTFNVYVAFQLPFDLVNLALVSQFFQWVEVSITLGHIIQLNERE